jgi:hypothetical protein
MSELLTAARDGDLAKMQRLIKEGASVHEVDGNGDNALSVAIVCGRCSLVQWLLEEGGANTIDTGVIDGEQDKVWDHLRFSLRFRFYQSEAELQSLLKVLVLFGEAPPHIVAWLSQQNAAELQSLLKVLVLFGDAPPHIVAWLSQQNAAIGSIAIQGQHIRALRPSYLEQQRALINSTSPLPTVLQSIVATYAEATAEDMWTEWAQWM